MHLVLGPVIKHSVSLKFTLCPERRDDPRYSLRGSVTLKILDNLKLERVRTPHSDYDHGTRRCSRLAALVGLRILIHGDFDLVDPLRISCLGTRHPLCGVHSPQHSLLIWLLTPRRAAKQSKLSEFSCCEVRISAGLSCTRSDVRLHERKSVVLAVSG